MYELNCKECEGKGFGIDQKQKQLYDEEWEAFYDEYGPDATPPHRHPLWTLPNGMHVCKACKGTGHGRKYIS